ncbi:MAG TPA: hypothetical protein PLQ11_05505 [Beijerinckiaceae bacterium]|nr:hypothetical protein [Beijerinckiaceae bacterium]
MKKVLAPLALALLVGGSGVLVSATPADAIGINWDGPRSKQKPAQKQQKQQPPRTKQRR